MGSIIFFIVGFLCRHFCQRKAKKETEISSPTKEKETPYYDNIDQFDVQPKQFEQNVAYGQVSQENF